MGFLNSCTKYVQNIPCVWDKDCPYEMRCGVLNVCRPADRNYGNALLKCGLESMPDEIKVQLMANYTLPYNSSYKTTSLKLSALNYQSDCIGSEKSIYEGSFINTFNTEGNYIQTFANVSSTVCSIEKQCNLEPTLRLSQTECFWDQRTGFCGYCDGDRCTEVGNPPICSIKLSGDASSNVASICSSNVGVVRQEPGGPQCYFPGALNATACAAKLGRSTTEFIISGRSKIASQYCYNTTAVTATSCKAGTGVVWDSVLKKCVYTKTYSECTTTPGLKFVAGLNFTIGMYDTPGTCPTALCSNTNFNTTVCTSQKVNGRFCSVAASNAGTCGICNDAEYFNSNTGLCTYEPNDLFQCGTDGSTETGLCILSMISDENSCILAGKKWIKKAMNQTECEAKGSVCFTEDGKMSLLPLSACKACGGVPEQKYQWSPTSAPNAKLMAPTWNTIQWLPKNRFEVGLTFTKVKNELESISAKSIAQSLLNDHNRILSTMISAFTSVECDCIDRMPNCWAFSKLIPAKRCKLSPNRNGECYGVFFQPSDTSYGQISDIEVDITDVAAIVAKAKNNFPTNEPPIVQTETTNLLKRCNPLPYYEIVYSMMGVPMGQIIGNGVKITLESSSMTPYKICLDIDTAIPQNKLKYPALDIGMMQY